MSTPPDSPWHAGELALQQRSGVVEKMDDVGRRVVRPFLTQQHRDFFPLLPMIVAGVATPDGRAWATLISGRPGFMQSPDPQTLSVHAKPEAGDPAAAGFIDGAAIGLLGIELSTRRRNRLNGDVRWGEHGFDVRVVQSFGNCNRYIQTRGFDFVREPGTPPSDARTERAASISGRVAEMIASADTFFVASFTDREDGHREIDVSHRGGRTGFVRIDPKGTLTVPDFAGNLFFSTLGNFLQNPTAGLLFTDFETGDMLQMSGAVEVLLDSPEIADFQGAERLWRFTPDLILLRRAATPVVFKSGAEPWSPATLMTGDWATVAARQQATALAKHWRPFRVVGIVDESSVIRSFHLEPADGSGIAAHRAGQFLPIRVRLGAGDAPLIRTYTLSTAAFDGFYRISVRRAGRVSSYLHDALEVGDVIEARVPAGSFTIDPQASRAAVLLAAGVGITPMLAMLREIVFEGARTNQTRTTWLFQAARTRAERAFDDEIAALAAKGGNAIHVVRSLSTVDDATEGEHYEVAGRLGIPLLKSRLPFDDYDFYICGPDEFTGALRDGLSALNVALDRIHSESFGSATAPTTSNAPPRAVVASEPAPVRVVAATAVPVIFVASGKEARWAPGVGSLLELAESRGLAPDFSCREGSCGTCRATIREGAVAYAEPPAFHPADGDALMCCAMPAQGVQRLVLDI